MKRIIILVLLLLVMAFGAFAIDKAIGLGGMYNHSFTIGLQEYEDDDYWKDWLLTRNGYGGFIFFGLGRYVELNAGFLYKNPLTYSEKYPDGDTWGEDVKGYWEPTLALQGGVYFKLPLTISDIFVFFPTVGADFEYTIVTEDVWWHDIWLRGGVGLDTFFTQRLFLRVHVIYGAALPIGDK